MTYRIREIDGTELSETYGIPSLCAKLLASADLKDEQIRELISSDDQLSTSKAPCVLALCERLVQARDNHEKVLIGGDYDADGICATAIMKYTLDAMHIINGYYIPDRFKEGYGLSEKTVRMAYDKGYTLIVTVDNGVKAHSAIACARELGMEIIITDHHRIEEEINADLVVHPDYMERQYQYLSGAGVALEVSRNLIGDNEELTAMAAAAAIGDVMPLWLETRKIVKNGLRIMARHIPRPLCSLMNAGSQVNMKTVAFQIVPKLNSVGRMNDLSNVNTLVPFLLLKDERRITSFALQVEKVNEARKSLSASEAVMAKKLCTDENVHVVCHESFHEGLCGLVAGKLASELHRPMIVMAPHGELFKGSGRSIEGLDLFELCGGYEHFQSFGGHAQAIGIGFEKQYLDDFREYLNRRLMETDYETKEHETVCISIEAEEASIEGVMALSTLDPLPKELDGILFAVRSAFVKVLDTPKVAKYKAPGCDLEAVLFKRKNITVLDSPEEIIGTLSLNRWNNLITPQIEIHEMR